MRTLTLFLALTAAAANLEENRIGARRVIAYLPPGYDAHRTSPYNLLLCFDGLDYRDDLGLPALLDNLIADGSIPPTVAILLDTSENRLDDLANHQRFATFIGNEVIPWIHAHYNASTDPARTIVAGYSAGGLAASYVAFRLPKVFGNVLSQSGAYWRGNEGTSDPPEWLTAQYAKSPKLPIRFYVEVGGGEIGNRLGDANRRFKDALLARGYDVHYEEVPKAIHDANHWRTQIAPGLKYLFSTK